jgi:hypothetical protein
MARKSVSTSNELENALAAIAEEMNLSLHELAGRLLENCQKVETLMMLHIVRVGPKKTLDELERKTFGQLLQKFTAKCKDAEAIELEDAAFSGFLALKFRDKSSEGTSSGLLPTSSPPSDLSPEISRSGFIWLMFPRCLS